jgi:transcription termination factor Rho
MQKRRKSHSRSDGGNNSNRSGSGGNRGNRSNHSNRGNSGGGGNRGGSGGSGGGGRPRGPRSSNKPLDPRPGSAQQPTDAEPGALYESVGILELHPNGYGFLRDPEANYVRQLSDPFVPGSMIEKYGLREGLMIKGQAQAGRKNQGPRLREISDVDGMPPDDYRNVRLFEDLTPITPEHWLKLETGPTPVGPRVMDLLTPLGKGQRALIVAPPRTGKTILLQQISEAVSTNHPEVKVIVLLIDERPEEVTDFRRAVRGEVVASSLDHDVESHVRISQLIIERSKRLAEMGKDCFLLLDSITRLARAFNKWVSSSGRRNSTQTGGLDIKAMDIPKKLFASARQFEEGGSLTIVGTALIDTNSRMDEAIFQEFKGTGNMELVLDRKLSDRRIWPSMDIQQSGTRREEKLLDPQVLHSVTMLRRTLSTMHPVDAMEQLIDNLMKFESNKEFIEMISGVALRE